MTFQPLTALATARKIATGELTCESVVERCLDRIAAREGDVRAWTLVDGEGALAQARAQDRAGAGGPLKGIPIGVKDLIDTAGLVSAYGSPIYSGHVPAMDASCVALTKQAGGIVLGKTVTTEFAYFNPGPTANPHQLDRTPGGSSSGSAAAVADGMVPLAFGTQTAGSIVRPAAYCGCVGYKPTYGLLDRTGIRPFADSLDTLGVLGGDVADAAFFVSVLSGRDELRVDGVDITPVRVGLCRPPEWASASSAMQQAFEAAAARLSAAGATVVEITLPQSFDHLGDAQKVVMAYEASRCLVAEEISAPEKLSPKLAQLLAEGRAFGPQAYDAARKRASRARHALFAVMDDVDVLMAPAAPGEAPLRTEGTGDPVFSRAWTLLGTPCVALPCGRGPHGLPLAIQAIGGRGQDAATLRAAAWMEGVLKV